MLPQYNPLLLSSGSAGAFPGSSFDIKFTTNQAVVNKQRVSIPNLLTTVRAQTTTSYAATSSGLLIPFLANTARITDLGLEVEEPRTNVVLWCRDLTNAAWTKSNATAALDQVGADGTANSATSLTATSGNGTCLQAITLASSARFQTAYVKRLTGSGTINMTMDNGSTWTAITVTSAYTPLSIPTQTLANPTVGFRIVTSGDAIAVDFVQNENGIFATTPILTTTVAVLRNADQVTGTLGSWFNSTQGTYITQWSAQVPNSGNAAIAGFDDGTTNNQMYPFTSGTALDYFMRAGGVVRYNIAAGVTLVNGATNKVAMAYGTSPDFGAVNGANTQSLAQAGLPTGFNRLTLGFSAVGGDKQLNGRIKQFTYIPTRLGNTQVTAASL